ncbi:MAG: Hamartin protein-domain-containing protein [Benniella sp.]|nr:MAG: Hamartin protein-domain-containing protein [Benniella sp.]
MSSSVPTAKDLYRVVTADLSAFLSNEKPREQDTSRETIQSYLDRFVKAHNNTTVSQQGTHHVPTPTTPSGISGLHPVTAAQTPGNAASSGTGTAPSFAASLTPVHATAAGSGIPSTSTAAGQRHANELLYQSLTKNTILQHPGGLPFAFHRIGHASSSSGSPSSSASTSQNASATGSPIIGGGGTGGAQSTVPGQATGDSGYTSVSSTTAGTIPLAAQRFSAHLITLFAQHASGSASIANITSRMIIYLTHLLPFLTPRLILMDWWNRMIEPSLQGEIKLSKDALKACRELVVECMVRDGLLDSHGSGTGTLLVAGDEEGQLDPGQAKAAMPIAQFVLRQYINAAHNLNHRLPDVEQGLRADGVTGHGQRGSINVTSSSGHAGHGSMHSTAGLGTPVPPLSAVDQRSEYAAVLQDMENQQRLFTKARAIVRRKKDILAKNLESILFAYGGSVGRVKDFFSCLYTYFVGARYRPEILGLLCQFIRRQRVHLHQILATPLFDSLLLSLKYDTSPLIVSLGLMTLIMLMPRIPAALNDRLPDLFSILSRIICWPRSQQQLMILTNQEGASLPGRTIKSFDEFGDEGARDDAARNDTKRHPEDATKTSGSSPDTIEFEDISLYSYGIRWRRYGSTIPGTTTEGAPDPSAIFSFLYGLFPCNLLKFLHSPREYMDSTTSPSGSPKQSSASHADEGESVEGNADSVIRPPRDADVNAIYIDEDLLKSRVQTLLKRHSLHPELLTLTPEQEIVNKARWQKLEPMEIVAMCVGLDIWSAGGLFGTGPVLRSIEEDRRGAHYQDSEDDDEVDEASSNAEASHRTVHPANPMEFEPGTLQSHSVQSQVYPSVDSFASEESQGTPIEILAREDFFGQQVARDSHLRPQQPTSAATLPSQRVYPGSGSSRGSSSPRRRTRSKEVRMSQILRAFATLRGLDQDEYLSEARNNGPLGAGLSPRERLPSTSEGTPITAASSAVLGDIPIGEFSTTQEYFHPATMANLALLNQEYRKTIVHLERELLVAKNELNFELFLKQQHIQQISKVHRAHVSDASVEAERQVLYNTCRSLKAQLQETKQLLEKEKSELEKRKNKQTHWDTDVKNKLQHFRDERKQLQFELERIKQEINDTRQSQEIQEGQLIEERKGTFQLKNCLEDLSPKLKKMEEYEKRIEEMTRQLVVWETEQGKIQEMQRQLETVVGRWQNLELLLTAEREEARILRNKVSQQSQVLDDMRIQMAIHEGREVGDALSARPHADEDSSEDEQVDEERPMSRASHLVENGLASVVEREHSIRRKASNNLRHQSSTSDMNWLAGYNQSGSGQQSSDQQRKTNAMQEFMIREKERWDRELQDAQYRWSREAMRNRELEDRILELQGQLEMARAIDERKQAIINRNQGGRGGEGGQGGRNNGPHEGAGDEGGHDADDDDGTLRTLGAPSEPQNVPLGKTNAHGFGMTIHDDHFGDKEMGEGGIESRGTVGRYSHVLHETDEEDTDRSRTVSEDTSASSSRPPAPTNKGKAPKQKSKSRWFSSQPTLERSQTDRGTYQTKTATTAIASLQSHLGSSTSGIFELALVRPPKVHRKSESSSTASSSAATRAVTGGLFPPILYTRNTSHLSDGGSSDIASDSDACTVGSGAQSEVRNGEGGEAGEGDEADSGIIAGSSRLESVSDSTTKKGKSKLDREREREKERLRLISGMGPLVDPSKMHRNIRMF